MHLVRTLVVVILGLTGVSARGQSSPAEREFKSLQALRGMPPPANFPKLSDAEADWAAVRNAELHDRGMAFIAAHPASPLRWNVLMLLTAPPPFTRQVTENGQARTVRDIEAYRAWMERYQGMVEELLRAPDASASARTAALTFLMHQALNWRGRIKTPEGQAVLRKMEIWWEMFERNHRRSSALINGARSMAEMLDVADPAKCERFLVRLQSDYRGTSQPDTTIRAMAEGRLKLLYGQAHEVWLRLKALDGQFADMRDYRGKIVLLALFPITFDDAARFLGQVHTDLQPRGIEIIHVTTGANMDRTASDLTAAEVATWVSKRGFPWRVVYDGKNAFDGLVRSLGLNAYPVYLVLSRDGRFVAETSSPRSVIKAIETELILPPEAPAKR